MSRFRSPQSRKLAPERIHLEAFPVALHLLTATQVQEEAVVGRSAVHLQQRITHVCPACVLVNLRSCALWVEHPPQELQTQASPNALPACTRRPPLSRSPRTRSPSTNLVYLYKHQFVLHACILHHAVQQDDEFAIPCTLRPQRPARLWMTCTATPAAGDTYPYVVQPQTSLRTPVGLESSTQAGVHKTMVYIHTSHMCSAMWYHAPKTFPIHVHLLQSQEHESS